MHSWAKTTGDVLHCPRIIWFTPEGLRMRWVHVLRVLLYLHAAIRSNHHYLTAKARRGF